MHNCGQDDKFVNVTESVGHDEAADVSNALISLQKRQEMTLNETTSTHTK